MKNKIFIISIVSFALVALGYLIVYFVKLSDVGPNIIVIEACTLRADHLSCYDYSRDTTPNINALAKEGILFENVFSQSTWTAASNASLLTSFYPAAFRSGKFHIRLNDKVNTLAELLQEHGYRTCAVSSNANVYRNGGFAQGFDDFYELWKKDDSVYREIAKPEIFLYPTASDVNSVASRWLEKHHEKKFFLFVLYVDAHFPYLIPENFELQYGKNYQGPIVSSIPQIANILKKGKGSGQLVDEWLTFCDAFWKGFRNNQEDRDHVIDLYDSKINYLDKYIGELLENLEVLGVRDDTLIIFTSDHGESLFERGMRGHHGIPYDEQIHIPLIMSYPQMLPANKVVTSKVQLIDVMPTVLDIANVPINFRLQGQSLLPYLASDGNCNINRWTYSDVITENNVFARAIRDEGWKLITTDKPWGEELYNLNQDPRELTNLAATNKKEMKQLKEYIKDYDQNMRAFGLKPLVKPSKTRILDPDRLNQLRALGYVQ